MGNKVTGKVDRGDEHMVEKRCSDFDRRSGGDRRRNHNSAYAMNGGVERRSGRERRSQVERRQDWLRINKWLSLLVSDLKGQGKYSKNTDQTAY
jgi:hypothetical protein